MHPVPLLTFCANSERLTTAKFKPLIMPNLREVVTKDGEVIICHLPLLAGKIHIVHQRQERL